MTILLVKHLSAIMTLTNKYNAIKNRRESRINWLQQCAIYCISSKQKLLRSKPPLICSLHRNGMHSSSNAFLKPSINPQEEQRNSQAKNRSSTKSNMIPMSSNVLNGGKGWQKEQ